MADYNEEDALLGLCNSCIEEDYIVGRMIDLGEMGVCDNCKAKTTTLTLKLISEFVDIAFDNHFRLAGHHPYTYEPNGDEPKYLISKYLGIDEVYGEIIKDIIAEENFDMEAAQMGESTKFGEDTYYEETKVDSHGLHWEWREFERLILEEARFFGAAATDYLDRIFQNMEKLQTKSNIPVVTIVGPETDLSTFYRGRYFHDDKKLEEAMQRPDLKIGPPPTELASAGRMNAKGISVFYGATHPQIALAEIRPPVGSRVLMGEFKPMTKLKLLNLSLFEDTIAVGSIFDPDYAAVLSRVHFLKSLVTLMTRPTDPSKDTEYLPTQVIADYLANAHPSKLDGILYPSSQSEEDGLNIVLFHRASKVKPLDILKGTEFSSHTYQQYDEDIFEIEYSVTELVPKKKEDSDKTKDVLGILEIPILQDFGNAPFDGSGYFRALTIDPETLKVHEITPIKIASDEYPVTRNRRENPFDKDGRLPF